ncbi:MAG: hypothetical protein ABSG73_15560 [Candidatus Aminicenantales bacterium]|jgi:hypothetical protein
MESEIYQVGLTAAELAVLSAVLRYALDACPVESIGAGVDISRDDVENLAAKLEGVGR